MYRSHSKIKQRNFLGVSFALAIGLVYCFAFGPVKGIAQTPTYRMEYIQDDRVSFDEVNNLGLVTGRTAVGIENTYSTSFVYDSLGLIADKIPGQHYLIEDIVEIPAPWIRFNIRGRNDNGFELVGWVEDASGDKAAAYIDLSLASTTAKAPLVLLGQNINAYVADDINDDGDILVRPPGLNGDLYYVHRDDPSTAIGLGIENAFGAVGEIPKIGNRLYDSSNNLVRHAIVSAKLNDMDDKAFRYELWSPIGNLEILESESFRARDMNNDGLLCGRERIEVPTGKGKKTKVVNDIGVFGSEFLSFVVNQFAHAEGINNLGDVVGDDMGRAMVFFGNPDDGYQSHNIEDLLEDGPEKDFVQGTIQRSHSINDWGQITLRSAPPYGDAGDGRYYLLTPIDPGDVKTYSSGNINLPIPDNNPDGRSHIIEVENGEDVTIVKLTVTVNISHQRPSDLATVTLTGPDGTIVPLNTINGNNNVTAFFDGDSTLGLWTIKAVDSRKKRTGTINSWSIAAEY